MVSQSGLFSNNPAHFCFSRHTPGATPSRRAAEGKNGFADCFGFTCIFS
jgi:hypothetical protein